MKGVRRALGSVVHGRFTNSFDRRDFSRVKKTHQVSPEFPKSLGRWKSVTPIFSLFLFDWDLWMCSKRIRSWMSTDWLYLGSKITWVDAQWDAYIMKFGVVTEWLSHLWKQKITWPRLNDPLEGNMSFQKSPVANVFALHVSYYPSRLCFFPLEAVEHLCMGECHLWLQGISEQVVANLPP